jgi:hypothetical protein
VTYIPPLRHMKLIHELLYVLTVCGCSVKRCVGLPAVCTSLYSARDRIEGNRKNVEFCVLGYSFDDTQFMCRGWNIKCHALCL